MSGEERGGEDESSKTQSKAWGELRNLIHISAFSINNFYFKFIRCLCENSLRRRVERIEKRVSFSSFLFASATLALPPSPPSNKLANTGKYTYFMSCIYLALKAQNFIYFHAAIPLLILRLFLVLTLGEMFFVDEIIKLWLNFCIVAIIQYPQFFFCGRKDKHTRAMVKR